MPSKKIVCLGGGSLFFCQCLGNLAWQDELAGSEVVLYDIDPEKAERMSALGQRFAEKTGTAMKVRAARQLDDAVDGADFAISSIGGSGAEMTPGVHGSYYHRADMHIAAKYGIQQCIGDTCGPAGMMMGLRSVPAYLDICRVMEKRAPNVILLNHSNPMAVIMRALHKYTGITAMGICHGVQAGIAEAGKLLNIPPEQLECTWIGTNHYFWFTQVRHQGVDVLPRLMQCSRDQLAPPHHQMAAELSEIHGHRIVYPDDGHIVEFYPFSTQARSLAELPYHLADSARDHGFEDANPPPTRHEPTPEACAQFMQQYQSILDEIQPTPKQPTFIDEDLGSLISAIATGTRKVFIVNIANNGAIPNLSPAGEVEVEAVTDSRGVRALSMGEAPPVLRGILEKRFAWQDLVTEAAVQGDRAAALQALTVDEMAVPPHKARDMLDELLEASRDLLPRFFAN